MGVETDLGPEAQSGVAREESSGDLSNAVSMRHGNDGVQSKAIAFFKRTTRPNPGEVCILGA